VCPSFAGWRSTNRRFGPTEIDGIEDIDVVVVRWPIATAKDDEFLADCRTCHGSQRQRERAADEGTGPVEGVRIEDIELVEAREGVAAAKHVDI